MASSRQALSEKRHRPVVSAEMAAQAAKVIPRGALNLIADHGVREMIGTGPFRARGILCYPTLAGGPREDSQ